MAEAVRFKMLYVAGMGLHNTSTHRMWAFQRLGQQVIPADLSSYEEQGSPLMRKLRFRLQMGPAVNAFNRELLGLALEHQPDVVWLDKQLMVQPATLRKLRKMGIATVNYTIDNPFGPRKDPGWRLYMKTIPEYDLHLVQREQNIVDYNRLGARRVVKIQTAFEPTVEFPPPATWSDKDRDRQVSFIGNPYDQRAEFMTRLWREFHIPLTVSGSYLWKPPKLPLDVYDAVFREGALHDSQYREGIWRSRINLSFVTRSNLDEFAHKSFEIAGAGGFLLQERSQGHLDRFVEDEECAYFSSLEECVEKIRRYLPDEAARTRIAAAGRQRAVASGYDNDSQMSKGLAALNEIVPSVRSAAGIALGTSS